MHNRLVEGITTDFFYQEMNSGNIFFYPLVLYEKQYVIWL